MIIPQTINGFKDNINDYNRLSGRNAINKYQKEMDCIRKNDEQKDIQLKKLISSSLDGLANYGKYNVVKALFNEIENIDIIDTNPHIYEIMGDLYKEENNIPESFKFYEKAYLANTKENLSSENINLEKKYLELAILMNLNKINEINKLKEKKDINSTINFLELLSLISLKSKNIDKSKNELMTAYFLAETNNIENDDLAYKASLIFNSENDFDQSSQICQKYLNKLMKNKQIYTHKFLKFLTLEGINEFNINKDNEKTLNIFLNAQKIEKEINNKATKEHIDYYILKILLRNQNINDLSLIDNFINNTTHDTYKLNIALDFAEFLQNKNEKELAAIYFDTAEQVLLKNKKQNEKKLYDLYNRLIEIYPKYKENYLEKISELSIQDNLNLRQVIYNLNKHYDNDTKLNTTISNIMLNQPNEIIKEITKTYQISSLLDKEVNYEKNISLLTTNLNNLSSLYKNNINNEELKNHLTSFYKKLVDLQYSASAYHQAAKVMDKLYEHETISSSPSQNELEKMLIKSTLMWYKDKSYYKAEERCLKLLKTILNQKDITLDKYTDINKLINNKNDAECRKIASVIETLGLINVKNKNYQDALDYYNIAIDLRNKLKLKDIYLANDYSAVARLLVIGFWSDFLSLKSVDYHKKCIEILKDKYPNETFTKEELTFHKKYYGKTLSSFAKYIPFQDKTHVIDKFKCYNKELNICE